MKGMGVFSACSVYYLGANWAYMLQKIVALPLRCLNSNRGSQMYCAETKQIVYLASLGAEKVEYSKTEKQVFFELDDLATQGQSKTNISAAWTKKHFISLSSVFHNSEDMFLYSVNNMFITIHMMYQDWKVNYCRK